MSNQFRILSLNRDWNGIRFISSLEHITLPFYGLQFHPEKNVYEWIEGKRIPHGRNAVKITQYFANFFVDEGDTPFRTLPFIFHKSKQTRTKIYFIYLQHVKMGTDFQPRRRKLEVWYTTILCLILGKWNLPFYSLIYSRKMKRWMVNAETNCPSSFNITRVKLLTFNYMYFVSFGITSPGEVMCLYYRSVNWK